MEIPFFSICIPQYNRTSFLIETLKTINIQTFKNFEVCISDGGSTDNGFETIESYLISSKMQYNFTRSIENLQYDRNLRRSISISKGRYLILMGNDDGFINENVLQILYDLLMTNENVKVAISNYYELSTKKSYRRMTSTGITSNGLDAIILNFRHFSFVSGIVLDGEGSRGNRSNICDGGEMYQMFLGAKLLTNGGAFLSVDNELIIKDIQVIGETVDSYKTENKRNKPFKIIDLPMSKIPLTLFNGMTGKNESDIKKSMGKITGQLYLFTYPYWIQEYKKTQTLRYSLGVYLGVNPTRVLRNIPITLPKKIENWVIFLTFGIVGFLLPNFIFNKILPILYRIAKKSKIK